MDLSTLDLTNKHILIIGCPASGKTTLAKSLSSKSHKTIHTDSFLSSPKIAMYSAIDAVNFSPIPTIVEGTLGYHMLRYGAQYGSYLPNIVIELSIPEEKMIAIYSKERDPEKIKYLAQFNSSNSKILAEYQALIPERLKPVWIKIDRDRISD